MKLRDQSLIAEGSECQRNTVERLFLQRQRSWEKGIRYRFLGTCPGG